MNVENVLTCLIAISTFLCNFRCSASNSRAASPVNSSSFSMSLIVLFCLAVAWLIRTSTSPIVFEPSFSTPKKRSSARIFFTFDRGQSKCTRSTRRMIIFVVNSTETVMCIKDHLEHCIAYLFLISMLVQTVTWSYSCYCHPLTVFAHSCVNPLQIKNVIRPYSQRWTLPRRDPVRCSRWCWAIVPIAYMLVGNESKKNNRKIF